MASRELDTFLRKSLGDPKTPPETRATVERLFAVNDTSPAAVAALCAQAAVVARAAHTDPRLRATLGWLVELGLVAGVTAATEAPAPEARVYFSPGETCLDAIVGAFRAARRSADVCVFTLTDDRIARAVGDAHRRGVAVRVVTDNDKAQDEGSDVEGLARLGIAVRRDETEAHMHHKFAVFDGVRLLTGSYNWTRSAARCNQENLVDTTDPRLVGAFTREFERLWALFGRA
ncbi:MAG: DUF1669 domain-containing protein [Deltaproteobacteria bacterium]|nr:DUF1669 domain-containing protein [Deltaproteobacteria bacterium]